MHPEMGSISMGTPPEFRPRLRRIFRSHSFVTTVLVLCALYAAFQLTPSSYGPVLKWLHVQKTGDIFQSGRDIRFDEWAVWTPMVQIAVNNGFERLNKTSPYGEDLRNFNALPLKD